MQQVKNCNYGWTLSWRSSLGFGDDDWKRGVWQNKVWLSGAYCWAESSPSTQFSGNLKTKAWKIQLSYSIYRDNKNKDACMKWTDTDEKTRSTKKILRIITSFPRSLVLVTISMDSSVDMEIKHIKLLWAPSSNASQADINYSVSSLLFHWKRGRGKCLPSLCHWFTSIYTQLYSRINPYIQPAWIYVGFSTTQ